MLILQYKFDDSLVHGDEVQGVGDPKHEAWKRKLTNGEVKINFPVPKPACDENKIIWI